MELQQYLDDRYKGRTAHNYGLVIKCYCRDMEKPEQAQYKDVLNYIQRQRSKGRKSGTLMSYLASIKVYYDYLVVIGTRNDHPCKHMRLKDRIDHRVTVQDLLSSTELELLMEQPVREITRKPLTVVRDKVIMSLLIYQALTTKNIIAIELDDVDLQNARIYIRRQNTLNSRTIELHPKQIMMINQYITEERPALNRKKSNRLILTRHNKEENGCSVHDVVKVYKPLYPDRVVSPLSIRQSVIANLLEAGKDVRMVQVFAGHKSPMTTERYQQTGIEELTAAVMRYHPLG
jgi:site-specific recombinase XerD